MKSLLVLYVHIDNFCQILLPSLPQSVGQQDCQTP